MAKDPNAIAQKWANNLGASGQAIQDGVNALTVSPTAKAAQAKAKWVQGIQNAANNGSWEKGLNNVTLQQWQQRIIQVGIPRIQQGAQAAQADYAQFMGKLMAAQAPIIASVQAMPNLTLQDNIARATSYMTKMAALKGKFK